MDRPFSQKTLDFLFENRLHDSREWFAQHKKEYQELVIQPLRQLVMDLSPTMLELDPEFNTEPKVDKTICRVWRDTRYTKDPSLYRDHMWILFKRGGRMHGTDHPGMYVEINQDGFSYGCGFYYASTAYMSCLRERILAGDGAFQAAQEAYLGQKVFSMEGDCYKRPRYGHRSPEEQLWLERRGQPRLPAAVLPTAAGEAGPGYAPAVPRVPVFGIHRPGGPAPRDGAGALAEVTEVPSLAMAGAGFFFRKKSDRFYGDATLPQVTVRFSDENLKKHASVLRFREIYSTMFPSCYMNCMGTEKWRKGICYPSVA